MKRDLRNNFKPDLKKDPIDGLFEKDAFVKIHVLMYKFKKFGHDMIIDANNRERLSLLAKIEQIKQECDKTEARPGDMPTQSVDELAKEYVNEY